MQPYFFPYIGYWQLINAVDTFVIYDDVNYIKQGYINRNSILSGNDSQRITLEVIGASSNKLINEIQRGNNVKKLLKTLSQTYSKAPEYDRVFPLIEDILNSREKNLAKFLGGSIVKISNHLKINTKIIFSSDIEKNSNLNAQDKILDICERLEVNRYINAIGGQELYNQEAFKAKNIELNFIQTEAIEYKQFNDEFTPYLSIIDIMMLNNIGDIKEMLNKYRLI